MIGWLIYAEKDAQENDSYIEWFKLEAEKQALSLRLVYREQLDIGIQSSGGFLKINGQKVNGPDFVVVRIIEPLLQKQFETMCIPTFNNAFTAYVCNHKAYTYLEMQMLGIPVMPTVFISCSTPADRLPFDFPFILKKATGSGGNDVHLINSEKKWQETLNNAGNTDYIAQSCQQIQPGKDVRVFVIGKEIIAAVLRSNPNDFRANFKLGGQASLFSLSTEMKGMIHKIIAHFDFGMVGIDFLIHENGQLIFNEIEDVVGSRILSATTQINLLEKYITYMKQTIESST